MKQGNAIYYIQIIIKHLIRRLTSLELSAPSLTASDTVNTQKEKLCLKDNRYDKKLQGGYLEQKGMQSNAVRHAYLFLLLLLKTTCAKECAEKQLLLLNIFLF